MKVDIKNSTGAALDYVAAKAFGYKVGLTQVNKVTVPCHWVMNEWNSEEDFSLPEMSRLGELMTEVLIRERYSLAPSEASSSAWVCKSITGVKAEGDTPQIAVARCLALDKLGEEIEIPDEVLNPMPW